MMSKEFKDALEALRLAGNALLFLSDTIEKVLTEAEAKRDEQPQVEEPEIPVTMADVKKVRNPSFTVYQVSDNCCADYITVIDTFCCI